MEAVEEFVKQIAQKRGINNHNPQAKPLNAKGEGFLGVIFSAIIEDAALIVKSGSLCEKAQEKIPLSEAFTTEITFYVNVWNAYVDFLNEKKVPLSQWYVVPMFYDFAEIKSTQLLALEDLRVERFEVYDKKKRFDGEHIEFVLKNYAKLHALSFAYKDQRPEKFATIPLNTKPVSMFTNDLMSKLLKCRFQSWKPVVDSLCNAEISRKFEKYAEDPSKVYDGCFDSGGEYSCVLHGDCWSNNMMFKYEDDSKTLKEMRIIDFQLACINSPVLDLSYLIYSSTERNITDHLDKYLKIYHDHLTAFLKVLGSDVDKLYPCTVLMEEWKRCAKAGFIVGMIVQRLKLADDSLRSIEDYADSEDPLAEAKQVVCDEATVQRILKDTVQHLHDIDAL